MKRLLASIVFIAALVPHPAAAATAIDGGGLGWPWAVPFAGMLISIATGPLLFPRVWHRHYGKIAFAWSAVTVLPLALQFGTPTAAGALVHVALTEYVSFIVVLFALYVVAGGILVSGNIGGAPSSNTAMLAAGTMMASLVGTTGAAMILIRPLLRANAGRTCKAHILVFFIILVANVGGALSPLGDPPLFVGFLRGVDFFWTAQHLWLQTSIVAVPVLVLFLVVDSWLFWRHKDSAGPSAKGDARIELRGGVNFLLIGTIIGAILASAVWKPGINVEIYGTVLALQNIVRDAVLILIALLSIWLTPDEHRAANGFTWEPIREVAKLFAGIFVTIIPVMAMLHAGRHGAFGWLIAATTASDGGPHEAAYFWLTGMLSAFLDNAPTYLVFFELAGGDAATLMGPLHGTLAAISMGAVYMGALTYIGNAPNFMIYAIAGEQGVRMPSFFAYLFWTSLILLPLFVLLTLLPVAPLLKTY